MKNRNSRIEAELLAPAGSFESLKAAVNAGADAVYIGGMKFGARAFANNLTADELIEALRYCHLRDRKMYLTVNTLLKDQEIEGLYEYLLPLYESGLDAVIVQDMGAFQYIREFLPELPIHASTQMTLTGADGAAFLKEKGASRVVMARELSLAELQMIHEQVDIEIESFIHGALCYCYSGQCLFSSLAGGRSGNRGRCAQPCRMEYEANGKRGFWLSPKDMCTLDILPEILESGVYSLKIEGRMKRAEYAAGVVSVYRRYLDHYLMHGREGYRVLEEDKRMLMELYNRGGFTTGYYQSHGGKAMMSTERANHYGTEAAQVIAVKRQKVELKALQELHRGDLLERETLSDDVCAGTTFFQRKAPGETLHPGQILHRTRDIRLLNMLKETYLEQEGKEKINGILKIEKDKPVILTVTKSDICVSVTGPVPTEALNQPMTVETLRKRINKTGNTAFAFEQIKIILDEGLFLPVQSLNELRRAALDQLERSILAKNRRSINSPVQTGTAKMSLKAEAATRKDQPCQMIVSLENIDLLPEILTIDGIDYIYMDSSSLTVPLSLKEVTQCIQDCRKHGIRCGYIMPPIFRNDTAETFQREEAQRALALFDRIVVKNYEEWYFLQKQSSSQELILDHNMYTFNHYAQYFSYENGAALNTVPVELNYRELQRRGCQMSELLVYGYLPMMISAQCLGKTVARCTKRKERMCLTDRKGNHFSVKNNCDLCYNTIYNHVPLHLFDQYQQISKLKPRAIRLHFTLETPTEARRITQRYMGKFILKQKDVHTLDKECHINEFTRGHFRRGIE